MNLKEFRKKSGLTQQEVSKALKLTPNAYGHYETGRSEPNIEMLKELSKIFHTTVDSLIGNQSLPYLLDKSTLTIKQRAIADLLPEMSDRICEKAEAYINGLLEGEKDKLATIQKFKN